MLAWRREDIYCLGNKLKWSTKCQLQHSHPEVRNGLGEGRKETGRGVGGSEVARRRLNAMKLWSEVCRGFTKTLSATQLHG